MPTSVMPEVRAPSMTTRHLRCSPEPIGNGQDLAGHDFVIQKNQRAVRVDNQG